MTGSPWSKLSIGTAQFGLNYGVNNAYGKVSIQSIKEILEMAKEHGVRHIDTAPAYGVSEEVLGKSWPDSKNNSFAVTTKLPPGIEPQVLVQTVKDSLKNLNMMNLYGLMFHRFEDFTKTTELVVPILKGLVEEGIVQRYGISIYHPSQLQWLMDNDLVPGIIQLPFSVLDRRFEKFFPILKKKYNVEIHVRSIFLQGIYFMKDNLPKHLMAFQVPNQKMLNFAEEINMPYAAFLLSFPFLNQFIDCVVIGFDSVSQFEEILSNVSGVSLEALDFIYELENEWLLNPSNWK